MRSIVSAPFRLLLYTVLMMDVSGGGSSDESDEDDEPVDYYLGNHIAIGPTKSGKTTAINNLLLNPCFGNLALYDNTIYISKHCSDLRHWIHRNFIIRALAQATAGVNFICSAAGWTTQDQRPKIAVLRPLLYPAVPYQGSALADNAPTTPAPTSRSTKDKGPIFSTTTFFAAFAVLSVVLTGAS
jgi:hypothetical protein